MPKFLLAPVLVLLLLFFTESKSYAQISMAYYSSSLPKIGVAYHLNEMSRFEMRLYTNVYFDNVSPELVYCRNISTSDRHSIYLGLGGVLNIFNGVVVPFGVQFIPIEEFKSFRLHIELQPMILSDEDPLMQASWGLRYIFGQKNSVE